MTTNATLEVLIDDAWYLTEERCFSAMLGGWKPNAEALSVARHRSFVSALADLVVEANDLLNDAQGEPTHQITLIRT